MEGMRLPPNPNNNCGVPTPAPDHILGDHSQADQFGLRNAHLDMGPSTSL